jgi:hypothetical protein
MPALEVQTRLRGPHCRLAGAFADLSAIRSRAVLRGVIVFSGSFGGVSGCHRRAMGAVSASVRLSSGEGRAQ